MQETIEVLRSRNRSVGDKPTSLWDLGYRTAGIDGGWEFCDNSKKTYHASNGRPMINTTLFPDMKAPQTQTLCLIGGGEVFNFTPSTTFFQGWEENS
jgi:hypothetical protein